MIHIIVVSYPCTTLYSRRYLHKLPTNSAWMFLAADCTMRMVKPASIQASSSAHILVQRVFTCPRGLHKIHNNKIIITNLCQHELRTHDYCPMFIKAIQSCSVLLSSVAISLLPQSHDLVPCKRCSVVSKLSLITARDGWEN